MEILKETKKIIGTMEWEKVARAKTKEYYKKNGIELKDEDIYVIWMSKTIENVKGIVGTTTEDKMMYEITYNGQKKEMYFDPYLKLDNIVITEKEITEVL